MVVENTKHSNAYMYMRICTSTKYYVPYTRPPQPSSCLACLLCPRDYIDRPKSCPVSRCNPVSCHDPVSTQSNVAQF